MTAPDDAAKNAGRKDRTRGAGDGGDEPVLPSQTRDDTDLGWNDDRSHYERDDDDRLLRERPPHWE